MKRYKPEDIYLANQYILQIHNFKQNSRVYCIFYGNKVQQTIEVLLDSQLMKVTLFPNRTFYEYVHPSETVIHIKGLVDERFQHTE